MSLRITKISLRDFLDDVSKILKSDSTLNELRAMGLTFNHPKKGKNISISHYSENAFNMSCDDPELLDKMVKAIENQYRET